MLAIGVPRSLVRVTCNRKSYWKCVQDTWMPSDRDNCGQTFVVFAADWTRRRRSCRLLSETWWYTRPAAMICSRSSISRRRSAKSSLRRNENWRRNWNVWEHYWSTLASISRRRLYKESISKTTFRASRRTSVSKIKFISKSFRRLVRDGKWVIVPKNHGVSSLGGGNATLLFYVSGRNIRDRRSSRWTIRGQIAAVPAGITRSVRGANARKSRRNRALVRKQDKKFDVSGAT